MGLEASIKTTLSGVAGGRVYPDTTPDNPAWPCIVYQQVGGVEIVPLDNSEPDKENARIQFIVWSKTRLEASAVSRLVKTTLRSSLGAIPLGAHVAMHDDALKLYGYRRDFSIWYAP